MFTPYYTCTTCTPMYSNIIEVCKHEKPIPPISESESFKLLLGMMQTVIEVFGITASHYTYAGPAGWRHFNLLLNALLINILILIIIY